MTSKTHPQRLIRSLLWSVLLGMGLYAVLVVAADVDKVSDSMRRLGWDGLAVALSLVLFNYLFRFLRWEYNLKRLGHQVEHRQSLLYYFSGFAFTPTPGKAGEGLRSVWYKRHGVSYVHSLAAFFTERFLDVSAVVLLTAAVAWAFPLTRWPIFALAAILIAVLPVVHHAGLQAWALRLVARIPFDRIRKVSHHLLELLKSASVLLRGGTLYGGLLVGAIAWGAEGVAFWFIAERLGVELSLAMAVGVYSASILIGALTLLPGGLGPTEGTMSVLLVALGADAPVAVATTVICRLTTLWFMVVLGLLALLRIQMQRPLEASE